MNKPKLLTLGGMILVAAILRLLPHPPNFTPIFAMALFGGAYIDKKYVAFMLPLAAMVIGDLFFGFHSLIPVVYGCIAIITALGFLLQDRISPFTIIGTSVLGSIIFYLISNFAVWSILGTYAPTPEGLLACYTAALPYFKNTLISGLFYSALMFGSFELVKHKFPVLEDNNSKLNTV